MDGENDIEKTDDQDDRRGQLGGTCASEHHQSATNKMSGDLICVPEEEHQERYERGGTTVETSEGGVSVSSKATDYAIHTAGRATRTWIFHQTNGMGSLKSSEMFMALS